jgi:hypothetical protein
VAGAICVLDTALDAVLVAVVAVSVGVSSCDVASVVNNKGSRGGSTDG